MDEHASRARAINAWYQKIDLLIDQVHALKYTPKPKSNRGKRGKCDEFVPNSAIVDKVLKDRLFYGRTHRSSFDTFPSLFKSKLENTLFKDHPKDAHIRVYYGVKSNPDELAVETLDDAPYFTAADIERLRRFNSEFVAFLDECIAQADRYAGVADMKRLESARDRVVRYGLSV